MKASQRTQRGIGVRMLAASGLNRRQIAKLTGISQATVWGDMKPNRTKSSKPKRSTAVDPARRAHVYGAYSTATGDLVYVGKSVEDPGARWREHRSTHAWADDVEFRVLFWGRHDLVYFIEQSIIWAAKPEHNIDGKDRTEAPKLRGE